MNKLVAMAPALMLAGCMGGVPALASASAVPAYQLGAKAVLARAHAAPMNDAAKAVAKAADRKAWAAVTGINDSEMRKAAELHAQIQGL